MPVLVDGGFVQSAREQSEGASLVFRIGTGAL